MPSKKTPDPAQPARVLTIIGDGYVATAILNLAAFMVYHGEKRSGYFIRDNGTGFKACYFIFNISEEEFEAWRQSYGRSEFSKYVVVRGALKALTREAYRYDQASRRTAPPTSDGL